MFRYLNFMDECILVFVNDERKIHTPTCNLVELHCNVLDFELLCFYECLFFGDRGMNYDD